MTRDALLTFLRAQACAVQASVGDGESPQAAVIGVAVTEELELVFDTLGTSRKAVNLRANPKIALDGIERYKNGYLISETGTSKVFFVTKDGSSVVHDFTADGLSAINDIGFDRERHLLAVPAYLDGTLTFYPLP